jgi:preprotein translocase subunit SecD
MILDKSAQKIRLNRSLCLMLGCCTLSFLSSCNLMMFKAPRLCEEGGMHLEIEVVADKDQNSVTPEIVAKTQKILSQRITNLGLRDILITTTGNHLLVDLPGVKDATEAEKILGNTTQLILRAQRPGTEAKLDLARQQHQVYKQGLEKLNKAVNKDLKAIKISKDALSKSNQVITSFFSEPRITGDDVKDAYAEPQKEGRVGSINVQFNGVGARKFTELTRELAGTERGVGIFLDDELKSSPTVNAQYKVTGINGGVAMINGDFTVAEAEQLVILIRSGNLPNKIQVTENKSIKPGDRCKK